MNLILRLNKDETEKGTKEGIIGPELRNMKLKGPALENISLKYVVMKNLGIDVDNVE